MIETWGFREDFKPLVFHHEDDDKDDVEEEDNHKEGDNDNNNILKLKFLSFGT